MKRHFAALCAVTRARPVFRAGAEPSRRHYRRHRRSADQSRKGRGRVGRRRPWQRDDRRTCLRPGRRAARCSDAPAGHLRDWVGDEAVHGGRTPAAGRRGQALPRRRTDQVPDRLSDPRPSRHTSTAAESHVRDQGLHRTAGVRRADGAQEAEAGVGEAVLQQAIRLRSGRGSDLQQLRLLPARSDHRTGVRHDVRRLRQDAPLRSGRHDRLVGTAASG